MSNMSTCTNNKIDFMNNKQNFILEISKFIGKVMSGKEFNEIFSGVDFVKLTNESENHNDYQFHDGLNIDQHEFKHDKKCSKGGFYFTSIGGISKWCFYNDMIMY